MSVSAYPMWKDVKAIRLHLEASPNKLNAGDAQGDLWLHCQNKSMVPCSIDVGDLPVSDPNVVASRRNGVTQVNVSRRDPRRFFAVPCSAQKIIGSWIPISAGSATIEVNITVKQNANGNGRDLGSATPNEYVTVK